MRTTGSLLLCWQTNIFSASYRYQPISSWRNSISFCCYLHHQFFNQQRLRAGHYKIPAQQQALAVIRKPKIQHQVPFICAGCWRFQFLILFGFVMFRCLGKCCCRLWLLLISGLDRLKEFNFGSFYAFVIVSGFVFLSPALFFALGPDGLENSSDHQAVVFIWCLSGSAGSTVVQ